MTWLYYNVVIIMSSNEQHKAHNVWKQCSQNFLEHFDIQIYDFKIQSMQSELETGHL